MRIESGHPVTADVRKIEGRAVRFVSDDGKTVFEVIANADGTSIEVRSVEAFKVDGQIYGGLLDVRPVCANVVEVRARRYE